MAPILVAGWWLLIALDDARWPLMAIACARWRSRRYAASWVVATDCARLRSRRYAASWVSDGLGDDVNDVRWMGIKKAQRLHEDGRVIFIDCREQGDYAEGARARPPLGLAVS